jgi:hypothetical protein
MQESVTTPTILVPLDGSPLSERALPYAEHLARATAARLVLTRVIPVHVIQPAEDDLAVADDARAYLDALADEVAARGLHVGTASLWGNPAPMIVDHVIAMQAQLNCHGNTWPIGSWPLVVWQRCRRGPASRTSPCRIGTTFRRPALGNRPSPSHPGIARWFTAEPSGPRGSGGVGRATWCGAGAASSSPVAVVRSVRS